MPRNLVRPAALLLAIAAAAHADPAVQGLPVRILVDSPRAGERIVNQVHQAPIRGTASSNWIV